MYCIVGLQNSLLMLILPCICAIFFLSILCMMKFFVKDFCETVQTRVVIFGIRLIMMYCIVGLQTSPFMLILSLYSSDFLSFHILNDENFRQRFL